MCRATGDPHYTNFDQTLFDFMGRGLYEFSRFNTGCGCEVEVQAFHYTLTRGYPGNSMQVAIAVRVATTVFVMLHGGVVSVCDSLVQNTHTGPQSTRLRAHPRHTY